MLRGELAARHFVGPYDPESCPNVHVNCVGAVPKGHTPGKWRIITNLSFPAQGSVNNAIDPALCSLSYPHYPLLTPSHTSTIPYLQSHLPHPLSPVTPPLSPTLVTPPSSPIPSHTSTIPYLSHLHHPLPISSHDTCTTHWDSPRGLRQQKQLKELKAFLEQANEKYYGMRFLR